MIQIKSIYLRNIYREIIKRKKMMLFIVILFTVIFGIVGYKKSMSTTTPSKAQEDKIQYYKKTIAEYDESISELNHSIEMTQKQIDQQQDYVDNSIYMKLDSQNISASSTQFAILNTNNTGNILTSFTYFINEGNLLDDLSKDFDIKDSKYLKELIMYSSGSNILNITVYHNEEGQNQRLMGFIEDYINKQASVIAKTQGEFEIKKISSSDFKKVDINVANVQNGNMNNLKSFINNKVDLVNKRISIESNKSSYVDKNETKINDLVHINPYKQGIKFAITGSVFGILLLWCIFSIKFILGNYIKSKEDLLSANLPVISTYSSKKGHQPLLERFILDMQLWVEQYELSRIFISVLSDDNLARDVAQEYSEKISQLGISVDKGYDVNYNAMELRDMINAKYSIVIVQTGKTSYSQISEQMAVCEKFGIRILGYVVLE